VGSRTSGERTRLACWFRRRAETIFLLCAISVPSGTLNKARDREDALASTRAACAPQTTARRSRSVP